jgi:hypothetical protein
MLSAQFYIAQGEVQQILISTHPNVVSFHIASLPELDL